ATLLAEVAHETGLPPGVLNLTHGFGPGSAGEFITTHPDIDGITFTGESATGAAIMRAVAPGVKPVSFELGGKNAALVFADADFEAAVDGTARSVF
ncbi:aldehyde dehydrogenase family protein, partial [Burkholderia contaminans]